MNLRYLRLKLLKKKENNKKICHIFHHNYINIPCYVMSEVSLKRFYFALFDDGLTLKTLKLAFIDFCIQTLQLYYSKGTICRARFTPVFVGFCLFVCFICGVKQALRPSNFPALSPAFTPGFSKLGQALQYPGLRCPAFE